MDNNTSEISLLATQSFIVDSPGTYMDYRDYILSLVSNPALLNCPIRINIENYGELVSEFSDALAQNSFSDFTITNTKPSSWSNWMLKQIRLNKTRWVMPFPGDHVYLPSTDAQFRAAIRKGEELGADAIAYGHVNDFESFLDWRRVKVLYVDRDYVLFEWGTKWRGCHNKSFQVNSQRRISKCLSMPAVIGFCIYTSELLTKILLSMPEENIKWHEMERVYIEETNTYKVLVPRKLLYYHVHNYWLGVYQYCTKNNLMLDYNTSYDKLLSLYVPTNYNWETTSARLGVEKYKQKVIDIFPDTLRSLSGDTFKKVDQFVNSNVFQKTLIKIFTWFSILTSKIYFFSLLLKKRLSGLMPPYS